MTLAAGTILGQYQIRSPLGAGGMGEVYRAHETRLDREVAIKVLPESLTSNPDRLRRFEQEARAAAALNHPNILAVYQMATHEGVSYMVTELLDGETLRERLGRGAIPLRKAIEYGVQIAHGLAAAHEKGIVHRDLKPENLFVTKDGRVKILDFGLAKVTPTAAASDDGRTVTLEETEPGVVLGTVGYMSPEQARGLTADHRSDIFSFGTILYEMVTGTPPFRKATKADTVSAILQEDPPPISQVAPTTSPGLQRVMHRCLEKDPGQRFHSTHDLAFALEALTDSSVSPASGTHAQQKPLEADLRAPSPSGGVALLSEQPSHLRIEIGEAALGSKWAWLATGAVVAALIVAAVAWWARPPEAAVVEAITQITDDGQPKGVFNSLQTDGSRLYFNEGRRGDLQIAQVAVTGGPVSIIPTPLIDAQPGGVAPDGSFLAVLQGGAAPPSKPIWKVPLPIGGPMRLGDLKGQDVSVTPDGHLLISDLGDLYMSDGDGSNMRKLISGMDGFVGNPAVSPDGKQIAFSLYRVGMGGVALYKANSDGSAVHELASNYYGFCCPAWTTDGRYLLFETRAKIQQELWYLPMPRSWWRRRVEPRKLTALPMSFHDATPNPRDGKTVFAIGTRERGELVRYDAKTKRFVPYMGGVSATDVVFSRDGQWAAYNAFPELTLWRSRVDGSDRMQLSYEMVGEDKGFSPDGKSVAFNPFGKVMSLVSIEGRPRQDDF